MKKAKEVSTEDWIVRVTHQNAYLKGDWFATSQVRHRLAGADPATVNRILETMVDRAMLDKRTSTKGTVNTRWYRKVCGYNFIRNTTRTMTNAEIGITVSRQFGVEV